MLRSNIYRLVLLCILLCVLLRAWLLPQPVSGFQAVAANIVAGDDSLWTRWHPDQYALADDGPSLWIGAAGSLIRWEKSSQTYRRYGPLDGLPQQAIYAIAVDSAGNRWFGGDGGLSRLDSSEQWTHFTVANSGLANNLVDAIAVGADNTLWLGHGADDDRVSQRNLDGSWQIYPSRRAAVEANYAAIRQTQNVNRLWTVVGSEVWVDYSVYTGAQWLDRTPTAVTTPPVAVVADSAGVVWTASPSDKSAYKWDGAAWSVISLFSILPFDGRVTSMAVGPDDTVWIGFEERPGFPYASRVAGYAPLHDLNADQWLPRPGPVAALLPTTAGLWAIGPAWLLQPDGTLTTITDTPRYAAVTDAVVDGAGLLWLHSEHHAPYSAGNLQILDDRGDPALGNDRWTLAHDAHVISALERTLAGDLWLADFYQYRWTAYWPPRRWHDGAWITTTLPVTGAWGVPIDDIFAQDDAHTWFVARYADDVGSGRGVLALDDGGTVAAAGDDQWQIYPLATNGTGGAVAVDALGRRWFGDSSGLYRHDGSAWQAVSQAAPAANGVCDLTPAADGTLFVQVAGNALGATTLSCDYLDQTILTIGPDDSMTTQRVDQLVAERFDLVRTARHRNRLWSVAPDGAVWYLVNDAGAGETLVLHRRSVTGLTRYTLPFATTLVRSLEIDPHNHVWLVANRSLWRLSGTPTFSLTVQPDRWLLQPGAGGQGQVSVERQEGFTGTVTLSLTGFPVAITPHLTAAPVAAGQRVTLTLQVAAEAALGVYPATLLGTSGTLTQTTPLTVYVVAEIYAAYLPVVPR